MVTMFLARSGPAPRPDPAALFASIRDAFDAIDLDAPLPRSVVAGTAVARSNGDGIEPDPDITRLLVLVDRGVISIDESVVLTGFLLARRNG